MVFAHFLRKEGGGIAIMAAAFLACIAGCSAFAVDVGRIYLDQRHLQSAVDLAAIEASRNLARANDAARATLIANGFTEFEVLTVTTGRYDANAAIQPANRFATGVSPAQTNAVRVDVQVKAPLYFGAAILGQNHVVVKARATGRVSEFVSFSIGSRLLSLNGGLLNTLLSGLLGGGINLSVMDYNALIGANINLLEFLDTLALDIGLTAGNYQQLLDTNVGLGQVLQAAANASQNTGVSAAVTKLLGVANALNLQLATLVDLGPLAELGVGTGRSALGAAVNVFDLLRTMAEVANGKHQAAVNLNLGVPGLLGVQASVTIGERPQNSPWLRVTDTDVVVRTAQTRIRLQADVGGSGLLLGTAIRLPIHIDIASAEARLARLSCGLNPATDASVRLGVKTGIINLWVAEPSPPGAWTNPKQVPTMNRATLVHVPLLATIRAKAHIGIANGTERLVDFNAQQIAGNLPQNVKTVNIVGSLVSNLVNDLELNVNVLGIGLGLDGLLSGLLRTILTPVGTLLDPVLNELLNVLGVGLGEADVRVNGIRCDGGTLAA